MHRCDKCGHVQVTHGTPGKIMYCTKCNKACVILETDEIFGKEIPKLPDRIA